MRDFTHTIEIDVPPAAVIDAFFTHETLAVWWGVKRSLCVARPLGSYAVEWDTTSWQDDILGRLGGALRGTVIEFKPGREFFVADTHWLPPDGPPIGPMALEIICEPRSSGTTLRVRQSGWEDTPRWNRYYELLGSGFSASLAELKRHLELWTK